MTKTASSEIADLSCANSILSTQVTDIGKKSMTAQNLVRLTKWVKQNGLKVYALHEPRDLAEAEKLCDVMDAYLIVRGK